MFGKSRTITLVATAAALGSAGVAEAGTTKADRELKAATSSSALRSKDAQKRTAAVGRVQRAVNRVLSEDKARRIRFAKEWASFCEQAGGKDSSLATCGGSLGAEPGAPAVAPGGTSRGPSGKEVCNGYVKQRHAWTRNPTVQALREKSARADREAAQARRNADEAATAVLRLQEAAHHTNSPSLAGILMEMARTLAVSAVTERLRAESLHADAVLLFMQADAIQAREDSAPTVGEDGTRGGGASGNDDLARRRCEQYLAKNYLFDPNGARPTDTNTCDDKVVNPAPSTTAANDGGGQGAPAITCGPKTETVTPVADVAKPKPASCTTIGERTVCDDGVKPNVAAPSAGPAPVPPGVQACDPRVCAPPTR